MVDGVNVVAMATSQDHKRVGDGDSGPNTGGMGAYSPAPVVTPAVFQRVMDEVIYPTVRGMAAEGNVYTGFLYAGLMIDGSGAPKVIEFNCRFGDPETQPIMLRLRSDSLGRSWYVPLDTVVGDAVNLGSRLEGLTKQYGVNIIVSEFTRAQVPEFVFRDLDLVRVKGKDKPVAIYEPVCAAGEEDELRHARQQQGAFDHLRPLKNGRHQLFLVVDQHQLRVIGVQQHVILPSEVHQSHIVAVKPASGHTKCMPGNSVIYQLRHNQPVKIGN